MSTAAIAFPSRAAAAELIASSPSRPSADPYAGLPSNACGGFHLKIANQMATSVRSVTLAGARAGAPRRSLSW
jgi:hypothetical protein